ncbi:MAG: LysM peptidoglycan-binding domain-containing protein [Coxiellaceae bacterium]|nr:MAG: LysM peptidoglycan-binding domain-containing protein [Coxiellaceae bacterium]
MNIQIAYEPNPDFHTKTYYDRNRQTKQRIYSNPANATVSWKRDYFGLATDPENHRDHVQLDGVVIQYTYDFKRQILRQHAVVSGRATALELQEWSDFSNQGPLGTPQAQTYYQTIEQKLELQDLYFTYQVGRVVEVWDAVRQRKTVNGYNQEGYHVIRELRTVTGTIIRHWESQLNALNWPTLLRDTLMVMQRYYDGVGNRISEQVMLMGGENWEVIYQQSVYSTYDKDNSVLVDGGILKDGVIQISSAGGHLYTQSQGFRQKEQVYNLKGELVTNDLGYDGEGLLVKNGETELVYDGSRRRKLFNRPGNIIQDEYDENSWQVSSNQESAGNGMNEPLSDTVTLYSNYITEGIATVEKTNYYSDPNQTEDNLSWLLYGFDNYERRTLSGTRKDKNGDPHYVSTMEYERDGNQAYSGIKATSPNVQDPTKTDESEIVIDSTYDNLMLLKKTVGTGKTYPVSLSVTYEMPFYDPEGMYLGSYQHTSRGVGSETLNPYVSLQGIRQASSPLGPVSHGYRPQGWMNHGYDPSGYGEVTSINRHSSLTLADYTQPLTSVMQSGYTYQGVKGFQAHTSLSTNYPAPTPKVYQVQSGDTFKQISQKNYTTDQYEDQIKQASGLTDDSQLQPGMSIELPMLISSFNNADTYFPKQDVLNNLVGNYYPYLIGPLPPPPKHQHNWWKVIVASLIDAAIIAIMPHLMPLALGISASATGWAGFFLNTAIGAASGLSTQMANDALGVSHGFSWRTFGASVVGQQLAFLNPTNATMKSGLWILFEN